MRGGSRGADGLAGESGKHSTRGEGQAEEAVRGGRRERGTAILALTGRGVSLALAACRLIEGSELFIPGHLSSGVDFPHSRFEFPLSGVIERVFLGHERVVLVMALGAAVRLIAPMVSHKASDPGVVVIDDEGENVISLLSGHHGGANALARELAAYLGANAVITTATDLRGMPALDLIIEERGWKCEDEGKLPHLISAMLEGERIYVHQDANDGFLLHALASHGVNAVPFDADGPAGQEVGGWRIVVSDRETMPGSPPEPEKLVRIRARKLVVGIGCRRGVASGDIEAAVAETLRRRRLSPAGIGLLATVADKKDEAGLLSFARERELPLRFLSRGELEAVESPSPPSPAVARTLGISGVCEKAAIAASGGGELLVPKTKFERVTVAVAAAKEDRDGGSVGRLTLVGIASGDPGLLPPRAWKALRSSQFVIGYRTYIDQVRGLVSPSARTISFAMGEEMERARAALRLAEKGKTVCLVSGGDPGIYGMAGVLGDLALSGEEFPGDIKVEIVPGIPALCAAAALLGSPLSNDFSVVSLSDYLTPWESIEKRIRAAAAADMVLVLYNPSSSRRREGLRRAAEIAMEYRAPDTPVGVVRNAFRPGQEVSVKPLAELARAELGMDCLVIMGNSTTCVRGGMMITPRGYEKPSERLQMPHKW